MPITNPGMAKDWTMVHHHPFHHHHQHHQDHHHSSSSSLSSSPDSGLRVKRCKFFNVQLSVVIPVEPLEQGIDPRLWEVERGPTENGRCLLQADEAVVIGIVLAKCRDDLLFTAEEEDDDDYDDDDDDDDDVSA